MFVRLTRDAHYPAGWVFRFNPIPAGSVVPAVKATNIPGEGNLWIDTPELQDDAYGILLRPGDYETLTPADAGHPNNVIL